MNWLRDSLILIFLLAATAPKVFAQVSPYDRYDRRWEPSRPALSPYLNLTRPDVGTLPNYQSIVRPLLRQAELNQRAARMLEQNRQRIQRLDDRQREDEELIRGRVAERPSGVAPTGTGSVFRSYSAYRTYSHYFPPARVPRRR